MGQTVHDLTQVKGCGSGHTLAVYGQKGFSSAWFGQLSLHIPTHLLGLSPLAGNVAKQEAEDLSDRNGGVL